ncbi:hypothetical protein [Halostreptopolyspora alba]|uniref:Uncharacterized protein n=1 Tax=Halostreptopolyspora alba TaxID=2487137 RepID=A0A3N0EEA5_9ACTN|nr:hypothetical protein EFW17_06135 [Nocardiopsaceae bacterium YIM 96095]
MRFRMNGEEYRLGRAWVEARMADSAPEEIREHWVEVNGRRWPPKQVLEAVLEVSRADFTTHTALRHLGRLGFATSGGAAGVDDDETAPAEALRTLIGFTGSGDLTEYVAGLEGRLHGADRDVADRVGTEAGLGEDLLRAALLIRRHAGRINDIIHAATIAQVLPLVLHDGERITQPGAGPTKRGIGRTLLSACREGRGGAGRGAPGPTRLTTAGRRERRVGTSRRWPDRYGGTGGRPRAGAPRWPPG